LDDGGGLGLGFVIDKEQRGLYAKTLAIGFVAGFPAIMRDILVRRALSAEGVARFGLLVKPTFQKTFVGVLASHDMMLIPCLSIALLVWLLVFGNHQLIYLWCVATVGLALSYSSKVTGIYLHDYHWGWLARPMFSLLLCLAAATVVTRRVRLSSALGWTWGIWVFLFFLTGLYVSTLDVRGMRDELRSYSQYKAQRLGGKPAVLNPRTMIGGDDEFCVLAVIGENMRALAGWPLYLSMALNNSDLYTRYALNQYLNGVSDRNQFRTIVTPYGVAGPTGPIDGFVRAFDEVSSDPRKFLDAYNMRYVALRVDQRRPAYIKDGWLLVERGPYWQIWQRVAHPPIQQKASVNDSWWR